jgi:hypothetical protein
VGCVIPEPEVPFIERELPLFLLASEIIHSKKDALQFHAFNLIVKMHDFTPLNSSDDSGMDGSDSGADDIPGRDYASSSLRPWPEVYRCRRVIIRRAMVVPSDDGGGECYLVRVGDGRLNLWLAGLEGCNGHTTLSWAACASTWQMAAPVRPHEALD